MCRKIWDHIFFMVHWWNCYLEKNQNKCSYSAGVAIQLFFLSLSNQRRSRKRKCWQQIHKSVKSYSYWKDQTLPDFKISVFEKQKLIRTLQDFIERDKFVKALNFLPCVYENLDKVRYTSFPDISCDARSFSPILYFLWCLGGHQWEPLLFAWEDCMQ